MKISKAITDSTVRAAAMEVLGIESNENFQRCSNQSFAMLVTDDNGEQRLCEVRFIVAALREDMTAEEILNERVNAWEEKKRNAEIRKAERAEKARKDKEKRKKKKEEGEEAE